MELDAGEADVISRARQLSPCMTIIDERRGRRIAQQVYGLKVKGTAGILVEAQRRGLISGARRQMLELRPQ
jgi:predicted nucleic acid-binding protein